MEPPQFEMSNERRIFLLPEENLCPHRCCDFSISRRFDFFPLRQSAKSAANVPGLCSCFDFLTCRRFDDSLVAMRSSVFPRGLPVSTFRFFDFSTFPRVPLRDICEKSTSQTNPFESITDIPQKWRSTESSNRSSAAHVIQAGCAAVAHCLLPLRKQIGAACVLQAAPGFVRRSLRRFHRSGDSLSPASSIQSVTPFHQIMWRSIESGSSA